MSKSRVLRAVVLASTALLFLGFGAAAWSVDYMSTTYMPDNVSHGDQAMRMVVVEGDIDNSPGDEPVPPSEFNDLNRTLNSIYPSDTGSRVEMTNIYSGYYYANLSINESTGDKVAFEIREDSGDIVDNVTEVLDIGNISVGIRNDKDELYNNMKFGETLEAEINLTGYDGVDVSSDADVDLWFTNGTWNSARYDIDNYQDGYFYNYKVEIPDNSDATYLMHVNASYDGASYNESYGSTSMEINTLPQIKAEFSDITTNEGCNNETFFDACERDAELTADLNITKSAAENVNMSFQIKNSTGDWENFSTKKATEDAGVYTTDFTVPDVDTSEYQKDMRIKYNATSPKRTDVGYYNIDYRSFKTFFRSASVTSAGDYDLNVEFRKFFTPTPLNRSRMSADVEVKNPNGEQYEGYSLDGMTYNEVEGWFTDNLEIPYDAEEGIWTVDVNATNTHGESKQSEFTFRLTNVTQTFTAEDSLEKSVDKRGVQEFDLEVENLLTEQELEIKTEAGEDISGFTTVNNGNNLTLSAGETSNFTVELNITEVDSYESEIELQDTESSYNETVDVTIDGPFCVEKVGPVCIEDFIPEVEREDVGHPTKNVGLLFVGEEDGAVNLTASIEGNISQYVTVEPTRFEMNATNDSHQAELNFSAVAPGYFTGNLSLSTGDQEEDMDLVLNSTVEPQDASFQVSADADFGYVEEGSDVEFDATIENTGTAAIDSMEYSSSTYTVDADSVSVNPGASEDVTITLEGVTSDSGQVMLTADTAAGDAERSISLSGNPVPNYVQQASELETQITNLDADVPQDSQLQTDLNTVQSQVSEMKSAYRSEDYQRAETLYSDIESQLDSISQRASQLDGGTDNTGQDTDSESGGTFLIIAAVIVILLLLGFVLYSSLIPEEGDPLYDVLGR